MANSLKIKYIDRAKLIPYVNNARTHSEAQVKQIAASIQEFGFTNPILIDEQQSVIAGHGRLMAAELLDLDTVPTIELKGLTEAQRKAYVIADNKLALNAGWNLELLTLEIETLSDESFDLELLGWDLDEIAAMLGNIADADFPSLDSDEPEHQQMVFIVHQSQADIIHDALSRAKKTGQTDTDINHNGNGNALAYICSQYAQQ